MEEGTFGEGYLGGIDKLLYMPLQARYTRLIKRLWYFVLVIRTYPYLIGPRNSGLSWPSYELFLRIKGPLMALQKLLPKVTWHTANHSPPFPLLGGPELAKLAFQTIYHREVQPDVPGDIVVRDEYTGWLEAARPHVMIDYYRITFDHLVPIDDIDPEVLQINIFEIEDDRCIYANEYSCFENNPTDYTGKKCLLCRDAARNGRGPRIGGGSMME